jgi:hypothetical protein
MPRHSRRRSSQSQDSLSLTADLIERPARQRRRVNWIIFGVIIGAALTGAAVFHTSPPLGLFLTAGPLAALFLLAFVASAATAGPRRRAREAALAEMKAAHRAQIASFRHADIPREVIELIALRRFTPAWERYEQLTGAPRPVADLVLNAYQVDVALARTTAATRREIPPEVVDLIVAGQRGQAVARYAALKSVPHDAAVEVLDTFP